MSAVVLSFAIIAAFVLAALFLYNYGRWREQHVFVTGCVLLAWHFSLTTVLVIPIDVSRAAYVQCLNEQSERISLTNSESTTVLPPTNTTHNNNMSEHPLSVRSLELSGACGAPSSLVPGSVLTDMWRIVYWSSQLLTWLMLPLMQSYTQAGDFTVGDKLRAAIVDNALYYGSYLLIAIVLLVYIAFRSDITFDTAHLKVIISSASNTWGLLLLVVLLGYSLVELPRALWRAGNPANSLQYAYFRAAKLSAECGETEEQLDDLLTSLRAVSTATERTHPLRVHVDTILSRVPADLQLRMRRLNSSAATTTPSIKSLVSLHRQVIRVIHQYRRAHSIWHMMVVKVMELEDVVDNRNRGDLLYQPSMPRPPHWFRSLAGPRIEWYWRCVVRGKLLQLAAICCALLSVMVVWSEVTFFSTTPTVSLFAVFVNAAKVDRNYTAIEVMSLFIILYVGVCAYYAIVNVRVFNFYYLASNHQTDQHSLIFSGMLICRLTPPLCLNFLSLIHMDSHVIGDQFYEAAYTKVMGHMDVLSILSDGFNIYWPMCVLAFCLATWFSLGSRLLNFAGFQQYSGRQQQQQDEVTVELVDEGRQLVQLRRRQLLREQVAPSVSSGRQQQQQQQQQQQASRNDVLYSDTYVSARSFFADDTVTGRRDTSPLLFPSASSDTPTAQPDSACDEQFSRVLYSDSGRRPPPSSGFFDDV